MTMWKEFKKFISEGEKKGHRGRILIAEDNLPDREFFCQTLAKEKYEPVAVEKNTLFATADKTAPQLIILSSGEKSLDLCARLKASRKTMYIPILIVTGSDDPNIIEYYSNNANRCLLKPIGKKELLGQVKVLIKLSRGQESV